MRLIHFAILGFVVLVWAAPSKADRWTDIWGYGRAGVLAAEKKDYVTARRNFDAAVQKYPKMGAPYFNRGRFFYSRGEYTLAVKDFDTAVRLRPTFWEYSYFRGITYQRMGRYDLALAEFNQILTLHPRDEWRALLLNERAWIEATCPDRRYRNGQKAIEDAKFAVRFGRLYRPGYLDTLAAAYAEVGDFDSAIKTEEQAIAAQTKKVKLQGAEKRLAAYRQHRLPD